MKMIRKTTTFTELLAACPYIKIKRKLGSPIQVAAWLEARLAEKGIQLSVNTNKEEGTGAFVRIKRNNTWQNIEIEQLTDKELNSFAKEHPEAGWKWTKFLVKWIRNNVNNTVEK